MTTFRYSKISAAALLLLGLAACTKLREDYKSSFTNAQVTAGLGSAGTTILLQGAYSDIATPFTGQDEVFSLEECVADEALVPTRGGDWDDNGVWRVLHNHTWNADHAQVLQVYNNLNKLNFDATNVLQFGPTDEQAAEARFLRAFSLYYLLDLYNQFPFRNPGDNLLNAPKVYTGDSAVQFLISELTAVIPKLSSSNGMSLANPDAARALLMKVYLNRGAFNNRAKPTFADADMQQVVTLGQQIMSNTKYSYQTNYFDNFTATNGSSTEGIFAYPNSSGVAANNSGPQARWMMTFHYNEYDGQAPNAGWNGFSTISDFYNAFSVGGTTNYTLADTAIDTRIGRRTTSNVLSYKTAGIRPGFLVGQQFDQNGVALKDRKGNPLYFTPDIASNMIETGSNLEVTGIRVAKYVPDFTNAAGQYYSSNSGNWIMLIRLSDVALMVAEAKMRLSTPDNVGALAIINDLRTHRGASTVTSMPLVNTANVEDPNTLLAERGRELYWESVRRTDLIRFGVFNNLWQYKPSDDPKYLVFPVPNQALAVNPNLKQNPGY
ncbi:MAG TPA: RagB/SusD family nutrient uptake outer membrane protein [Puia sp.]|uniref:RagB/SusD family nutrient uptake outer membrane protein n=1 Tax=Puia sp. TaxID=2045100 RepID=UPI002BA65DF3|nr:RagB/SusD family nutrient uptake outer membrane protein [Puia sp.]HVU94896.1 RagB/SusD family nutrient uptake outer membrane protein [Puia sp.]